MKASKGISTSLLLIIAVTVALFPLVSATPLAQTSRQVSSSRTTAPIASVLQPHRSPLVTFRFLFNVGSASDPQGKEGVAALTAAMLSEGGSRRMSYDEITNKFYPMATSFNSQVDKEMTVFTGTTHVDNLDVYYSIISQMLLDPGFRTEDFTRLRTDAINFLKVSLREGNDEELGKEQLYNAIYENQPYGHHNMGSINSLERLTLDDVREFYRANYTRANLVLGLAGGYSPAFVSRVRSDFSKLPAGAAAATVFAKPQLPAGVHIEIVKR